MSNDLGTSIPVSLFSSHDGLIRFFADTIQVDEIITNSITTLSLESQIEVETLLIDGEIRLFEPTLNFFNSLKANSSLAANLTLCLPTSDGIANSALITDGSGNLSFSASAPGDVIGTFTTDNLLVKTDFVAGANNIEETGVSLDDSNNMSGLNGLDVDGTGEIKLFTSNVGLSAFNLQSSGRVQIDSDTFIDIHSHNVTDNSMSIVSEGGIAMSCVERLHLQSNGDLSEDSIFIQAVTGGIDINTPSTKNFDVNSGQILLTSSQNVAQSINIVSSGGANETIEILNTNSASSGAIKLTTSFNPSTVDINGVNINRSRDIENVGRIQFQESGGGSNFVGFVAPTVITADSILILPPDNGIANQVFTTNGMSITGEARWEDVPYPPGFVDGLQVGDVSSTTKVVGLGKCRDIDDTFNLVLTGATNCVITTTGAGGLQTSSSEASDTWYSINIIGDSTGVNATNTLLIPDGTGFSESGYDKFRRVGWVRNNSSSNFYNYRSSSTGRDRDYFWLEDGDLVLTNGGATSPTAVDISEWAPPTCRLLYIGVVHLGSTDDFVSITPDNTSYSNDSSTWKVYSPGSIDTLPMWVPCTNSQEVYYENSSAFEDSFISQIGYQDSI